MKRLAKNKRAQSITEMAIFGTLLLIALSFLVRYGMAYNSKQRANMVVFKRALHEAFAKDSSSVSLVNYENIPNPQDRFGVGDRQNVQAGANIYWSNGISNLSVQEQINQTNAITYLFNAGKSNEVKKTYTTITTKEYQIEDLKDVVLKVLLPGHEDYETVEISSFKIVEGNDGIRKLAVLVHCDASAGSGFRSGICNAIADPGLYDSLCQKDYCTTFIVTAIDVNNDGYGEQVLSVQGEVGGSPTSLVLVVPDAGDINPHKMAISKDVSPERLQGLIVDKTGTKRDSKQTINTNESSDDFNDEDSIRYRVRTNRGADFYDFKFERKGVETWKTSK